MFVVIGVLVVVTILAFGLFSFSRENRFSIRRFHHTVLSDALVEGAFQEGTEWLNQSFAGDGAPEIRRFLDEPGLGPEYLSSVRLTIPLTQSRLLAAELGVELEGTLLFERDRVAPFFPESRVSLDPKTQGRIVPDPKECHGWALLALTAAHGDFTRKFRLYREFKFVNLLPPVVSKFTFFLREQGPLPGQSPCHLNNLRLDSQDYVCRGLISDRSGAKPLIVVNSEVDEDREGLRVNGDGSLAGARRRFDPTDVGANFLRKGWVFLGTRAPEGFILNLASGQLYDYLHSRVNANLYPASVDPARRYVGERFHCADVAELFATTNPASTGMYSVASLNDQPPLFPAAIPATPMPGIPSLRFKLQFFGSSSIERDLELGLPGLEHLQYVFRNYFRASMDRLGYATSDYRSQHASLLHLFGEEYVDADRYFDSRSPTLVLGPVRRRHLAVGSVHQESDYERQPPGYQHPPGAVTPRTAFLPWFDIDASGRNGSTDPGFSDVSWNQVIENDPDAGAPPLLPGRFGKNDYYLTQVFSQDPGHQTYYKNFAMSRFFEEPYVLSSDLILHENVTEPPRGSIYAARVLGGEASRKALVTIGPAGAQEAAVPDEAFFYDVSGGAYTASGLEIRGARLERPGDRSSPWKLDAGRLLFVGNLRALGLFSDRFPLRADPPAPGAPVGYDWRRKATHWFHDRADFERVCLIGKDPRTIELALDGEIVYVAGGGALGEPGKEIVARGPGVLIFEGPVQIVSSIKMAGETAPAARAGHQLPPLSIVSVSGPITLEAGEVHASLIALGADGTLRRSGSVDRVRIVGSLAVDHLELGEGRLKETTPPGSGQGTSTFTVSAENLLVRRPGDFEKLQVVYNDQLEPTLWENYKRWYRFVLGQTALAP